jgi:hypothetical protein
VNSALGNSNTFQKTKFWKEKTIENVVTLGPTMHATLVEIIFYSHNISNLIHIDLIRDKNPNK